MTLYTSKVIAKWLCLTERRVRQLRDEGVIVEARPGLYELQPTVARYIKYLGGAGKESLNTERMKLTAEKRKAAEMDNDLRRGDLHSTQDIEKGIQTMCLNIRSRFLAMLSPMSVVNLTFRAAQQVYDKSGGYDFKGLRVVEMARVKKFKPGKIEKSEGMEAEVTVEVTYIMIEVDGEQLIEIDKLNGVYKVKGVDMLAKVRSLI